MISWRRFWSGGEWTEVPGKRKPCKRYWSWLRKDACLNIKRLKDVLDKYQVEDSRKRSTQRQRLLLGMEALTKNTGSTEYGGETIPGHNFSNSSERKTCSVCIVCTKP